MSARGYRVNWEYGHLACSGPSPNRVKLLATNGFEEWPSVGIRVNPFLIPQLVKGRFEQLAGCLLLFREFMFNRRRGIVRQLHDRTEFS